jgi:hypothetical protein
LDCEISALDPANSTFQTQLSQLQRMRDTIRQLLELAGQFSAPQIPRIADHDGEGIVRMRRRGPR